MEFPTSFTSPRLLSNAEVGPQHKQGKLVCFKSTAINKILPPPQYDWPWEVLASRDIPAAEKKKL